jgi:hypothetical protein
VVVVVVAVAVAVGGQRGGCESSHISKNQTGPAELKSLMAELNLGCIIIAVVINNLPPMIKQPTSM